MGRKTGLPVLPGVVIEGAASMHHMALGAAALQSRGSGGARLVVGGEPPDGPDRIVAAGASLGPLLVARSSTTLESSGMWSGAFTSYLDITPEQLPKAVTGCWASAFAPDSLGRQEAAGIEPGSFPMAVLVQPALQPKAGGTATAAADGSVLVHGIKGSPAPLLQGWVSGDTARFSGSWEGDALIELVGVDVLEEIAGAVRASAERLGANQCEWALEDRVWILQLGSTPSAEESALTSIPELDVSPGLLRLVCAVVAAPGPIGERMVIPWAVAGLPEPGEPLSESPLTALERAGEIADELASSVWGLPPSEARAAAASTFEAIRGPDPEPAIRRLESLRRPDPARARVVLGLLLGIFQWMVDVGAASNVRSAWHMGPGRVTSAIEGHPPDPQPRVGIGQWEPLVTAVVMSAGSRHIGVPAAPGRGAGELVKIADPGDAAWFAPRSVVLAPQPLPALAPLLWDATGLVAEEGSPGAHLFDSARSLSVPAVCTVALERAEHQIVAVDGGTGTVAATPMYGGADV